MLPQTSRCVCACFFLFRPPSVSFYIFGPFPFPLSASVSDFLSLFSKSVRLYNRLSLRLSGKGKDFACFFYLPPYPHAFLQFLPMLSFHKTKRNEIIKKQTQHHHRASLVWFHFRLDCCCFFYLSVCCARRCSVFRPGRKNRGKKGF